MTNCKTCNAPIAWKVENGKYIPYEPDGINRHKHRENQAGTPSPNQPVDTRPSNGTPYIGPDMERAIRIIVRDEVRKMIAGTQI